MSKHVIITSIDDHYGDFLVNHWLRSLKENVDLRDIDIIILDFGLTTSQLRRLKEEKVIIVPCSQSGHIVNARFTKTAQLLEKNHYDQVLFVDGGDIIFQNNISFLFEQDQDIFRAAKLDLEVLFYEAFIPFNFKGDKGKKIYGFLKDKPVLNAGFILGPRDKFISLCNTMNDLITNKKAYGPDQVALNYCIHQEGVKLLDRRYNFMITTVDEGFTIKDGTFYLQNGEQIVVVHNAGHNRYLRPIINFGYGKDFNKLNFLVYHLRRSFFKLIGLIKSLR
ncbi:hypothetical protein A2334_03945 [Candidatus Roizmanbacteria bacterium RIFOXYB2_FULL_38_10]|uniref:Glycosyltransferase 2-like domain-containing protein n=1 Tax=Candidatus Roizmanbacteria bacterium RIFOXYD1_FULL_38_12 TaxID=1802093 RepID=A0A1F7KZ79_9BACT|nr:MAG: hypothetical protein A3K47_00055 [Candidatus Roizmanbacteria bacterium RIFOXYA2_FULL_38_14]OGK63194.1 MAG: hypothetical protein A3K27_00055 [Candidatus Roizmanbacteria bacterium RIFOXYA1_FULL_37_12]OGK65040.1 MAG: hypothetical protein A3K38_00055 [Candidatus Roizmanbacteria bacterium RIFOXYB1_FULL_40_23]OGK68595.1 MAG: hypothetical protein A2334_03945 [Candidatus Roizmanbacteria bacterium RIFOXYB2_FULL_38_10]OGK69443.1 MAG: hypothetical protein A3K21_00055 [Candidatus Roizmanbacteria ba